MKEPALSLPTASNVAAQETATATAAANQSAPPVAATPKPPHALYTKTRNFLGSLRRLLTLTPNGRYWTDGSFGKDLDEMNTHYEAAQPPHAEPVAPDAYRVDWPAWAEVGLPRFFGVDDAERMSNHVATWGPAKINPLYTHPSEPEAREALDAARYRWLRDNCVDTEPFSEGDSYAVTSVHFEFAVGEELDTAIDAALSKGAAK